MFRVPYDSSPKEMVPEALRKPDQIDLAEALFGYTKESGEGKKKGYASRLSFGDGRWQPVAGVGNPFEAVVVPKILSGPKPTTFQHYLVQDHKQQHDPDTNENLAHYSTPTPKETVIRGQKMYWHKGDTALENIRESNSKHLGPDNTVKLRSTQHTQFKPVKKGTQFSSEIVFQNLSPVELGALLWVLNLPGENGKTYRHKIGMGKPFGMGGIRIVPVLRSIDRTKRYTELFHNTSWQTALDPDCTDYVALFDDYMKKANSGSTPERVERIAMLMRMLEFNETTSPEHDEWTRYMDMEKKEYKSRPVLPDPLHILPGQLADPRPTQAAANPPDRQRNQSRGRQNPTLQTPAQPSTPPQPVKWSAVRVISIEPKPVKVVFVDGTFGLTDFPLSINAAGLGIKPGDELAVQVIGKLGKGGKLQYLRKIPKP